MKTLKRPEMETTDKGPRGKARKRSSGKQGRKNFPFSNREITTTLGISSTSKVVGKKVPLQIQSRVLQLEPTETELAKMKMEIGDLTESVMAAKQAAENAEAEFASLIARRDKLKGNLIKKKNKLLKMKDIEAFLMLKLGSL